MDIIPYPLSSDSIAQRERNGNLESLSTTQRKRFVKQCGFIPTRRNTTPVTAPFILDRLGGILGYLRGFGRCSFLFG
jgi:hypothetical protein